jgi:acetyl esterase/lipase
MVASSARTLSWMALAMVLVQGAPQASGGEPTPQGLKVKAVTNITYYQIRNDPDPDGHKLDVYRPRAKGTYPVVLLVHGGGWMISSKDEVLGLYGYGTIGRCLAERGLVVVVPNHRLSPGVRHPEHIKDVARAFDWTYRHCEEYGGDPRQLYVAGHSSGGHLVALLATDDSWLKQVGRSVKDIRGVIGVSGVYRLEEFDVTVLLGKPGGPLTLNVDVHPLTMVFGDDTEVMRAASPLYHVHPGLPPFLILSGGCDYPPMSRMAKDFTAELKRQNCEVEDKVIAGRTHETMVFDIPHLTAEPATIEAIVTFIKRQKTSP